MAKLFLGTAYNYEKSLIMNTRMLHFGKSGDFIEECPYNTLLVGRYIKEVFGVSVLACGNSPDIEIAYILNGVYGTFNVRGRLSVVLNKLYGVQGFFDTLTRHGDGYMQTFVIYDKVDINLNTIKQALA